jgi:anti-anti-sigma regulatory factor
MRFMPYKIALDRDTDRGLDRYTVTVTGKLDSSTAHQLSEWLGAASQNPTATFQIDVSEAPRASRRAVTRILAQKRDLRAAKRLEIAAARMPYAVGASALLLF